MPLIIPKAREIETAKGVSAPRRETRYSNMGGSVEAIGSILEAHEDRIQKQHDTAVVYSRVTEFRDIARDKMRESLNLEGEQAFGSMGKYSEWFDKESAKFYSGFENATQQEAFQRISLEQRDRDLDKLARHQAEQHRRHSVSTMNGVVSSAEREVAQNAESSEVFHGQVEMIRASADNAFPGVDNSAYVNTQAKTLALSSLKSLVGEGRIKEAKVKLEEYRDYLGDKYQDAKKLIDTESVYIDARTTYPEDYNQQLRLVEKADVAEGVKRTISERIRTDRSESDYKLKRAYANILEGHQNGIYGLIQKGEFSEAWMANEGAFGIDPSDKASLRDGIRAAMKGEDLFNKSDPDYTWKQIQKALKGELEPEFITPVPGSLSRKDANMVRGIAIRVKKKSDDVLNKLHRKAVATIERQVLLGNQLVGYIPESIESSYSAVVALETALAAEKDPAKQMKMLTPGTNEYVLDDIMKPLILTFGDQMKKKVGMIDTLKDYNFDDTGVEEKPEPKATDRIQGETVEEYWKRMGW